MFPTQQALESIEGVVGGIVSFGVAFTIFENPLSLPLESIALILSLFLIINSSLVLSISNEKIVDTVATKIYDSCKGKSITLFKADSSTNMMRNENFEIIKKADWPWDLDGLKRIISLYRQNEPYRTINPDCNSKVRSTYPTTGPLGCKLIECDGKRLDIITDNYYWNGEKIDATGNTYVQDNSVNINANDYSEVNYEDNREINNEDKSIKNITEEKTNWLKWIVNNLLMPIIVVLISAFIIFLIKRNNKKVMRKSKKSKAL